MEEKRCKSGEQPDIVLVMSDQHNGLYSGLAGAGKARTPFLSELAGRASVFTRAYCNVPLCVPSRCSFLTGRLPHELGIWDNDSLLPEDVPTVAHAIAAAGYETVLAGRMHFKGSDQNHGFLRRRTGDITTQYWGIKRSDLGDFAGTLQASGCQAAAGCGPSPIQEYDAAVTAAAVEELERSREKPLFLLAGLYAPHFPYVAPDEEFAECMISDEDVSDTDWTAFPCWQPLTQPVDAERTRLIRAAYRAMILRLDRQIGEIYRAFQANGTRRKVFIYVSDHGDQLGRRGIFGKKTLYEDSVRIPLIIEDGEHRGVREKEVSLIDLSRTLLDYAGAKLPGCAGRNLYGRNRKPAEIETVLDGGTGFAKAVICDGKKLLRLPEGERLCVFGEDVREEADFSEKYPQEADSLREYLPDTQEEARWLERYREHLAGTELLKTFGKIARQEDTARFALSADAVKRPEAYRKTGGTLGS